LAPIPNPQSPIPNPHPNKNLFNMKNILFSINKKILKLIKLINFIQKS